MSHPVLSLLQKKKIIHKQTQYIYIYIDVYSLL